MNRLKSKTTKPAILVIGLITSVFALQGCIFQSSDKEQVPAEDEYETLSLEQGWDRDQRLDFYNTSQGSQLIPYSWFMALEQADNEVFFLDDKNIRRLGYIPQKPIPGRNSDGLPIGFVKDDRIESSLVTKLSASRIQSGAGELQREYNEWLGLTCAACHTSELRTGKHRLIIDGGPPLSDFQSFIQDLSKALHATVQDDAKLTRFAENVFVESNEIEKQRLKLEITRFNVWLDDYIQINYAGLITPYGYGRLDAFGAILNRVTASFTGIDDNAVPADAPVSYPFLWNTSQLSWVQWNGSANNHIGRNVGEVSGVFAHTIVKTSDPKEMFDSSANIVNLDNLERLMSGLDSPKWQSPLPAIDQAKAAKGKDLYASNCVFCHSIRDEDGQFPMTAPNPVGAQFIDIKMTPLRIIGTDPLMAMNFVNPALDVDPGVLRSFLPEKFRDADKVPRGVMLSTVVRNVIGKQLMAFSPPLDDRQKLALAGNHIPPEKGGPNPPDLVAYKARPLNGAWATAPYLHNGSVQNLYQLLLPDNQRQDSFYIGSTDFDSKNVGFESSSEGNSYSFNTVDATGRPVPGNGKHGHSGKLHTSMKRADGQWSDYTDEERYQLIEYLKTL